MISERGHVDMDEAFNRLRAFARNNNRGLTEVAESLVAGTINIDAVWDRRRVPPPPPRARRSTALGGRGLIASPGRCAACDFGVPCLHGAKHRSSRVAPVLGYALVYEEIPTCAPGTCVTITRRLRSTGSVAQWDSAIQRSRVPAVLTERLDTRRSSCGADQWRTRHRHPQQRAAGVSRRTSTTVVVEMADMTFMDCCGYGGLVAARRALAGKWGLADAAPPGRASPRSC